MSTSVVPVPLDAERAQRVAAWESTGTFADLAASSWETIRSAPWIDCLVAAEDAILRFALNGGAECATREQVIQWIAARRTVDTATVDERARSLVHRYGGSLQQAREDVEASMRAASELPACEGEGPCALYRHFDANGDLLYVGISDTPALREQQHRDRSPWFPLVAKSTHRWFDTRSAAASAEREAIRAEGPIFNRTHNPGHVDRAIAYLMERAA